MRTLTADRFPTVAIVDYLASRDGEALGRLGTQRVDACAACPSGRRGHGTRWGLIGDHEYIEPGTVVRKLRILARRRLAEDAARQRAEYAELVAEIRSWNAMEDAAPKMRASDVNESHEVLDNGRWWPVRSRDESDLCGSPAVWLGLDVGVFRAWPLDALIPARTRTTDPTN